ncbi:MAG: hypothetical protein AAGD23_11495 [Pseudomonadota bacterium]
MPVPVVLSAALSVLGVAFVAAAPKPDQPMLAIYAPGTPEGDVVRRMAAADGLMVATTGVPWAIITHAEDGGLSQRLRAGGALLTLDPRIAALCFGGANY